MTAPYLGLGCRGRSPQAHIDAAKRFDAASLPATLPSSVDLSQFVTYIWHQADGYCVGHGSVGAFSLLANEVNADNPNLPLLSPAFVQCWALVHDGDFPTDIGSYPSSGIYAMQNQGICTDALYPSESNIFDGMPPPAADADGLTRKLTDTLILNEGGSGQALVDQMRQNLASGFPCVGGFMLYTSFAAGGIIPMPPVNTQDTVWGGHEVYFVGYNDTLVANGLTGYFKFYSSWGSNWSYGGWAWLPYAYLLSQTLDVFDFWTIRADTDPLPTGKTVTTTTIVPNAASVVGANPTGTITIVATYSGDANNAASTSTETITLGTVIPPPTGKWAIPPSASGTDSAGNTWSIATGGATPQGHPVLRNGVATGANGVLISYDGTTVIMQSLNPGFPNRNWKWNGTTWTAA